MKTFEHKYKLNNKIHNFLRSLHEYDAWQEDDENDLFEEGELDSLLEHIASLQFRFIIKEMVAVNA